MGAPPQLPTRIRWLRSLILVTLAVAGCSTATRPEAPAAAAVPATPPAASHGQRYEVVPADSLLTIRVYRGGTLARMGHNHVIASHDLAGTVFVPEDLTAASIDVHFPVAALTVDEPDLRKAENSEDFAAEVPESAREGTQRNMLGAALLDADHFPEITLRSEGIEVTGPNEIIAHLQVTVRDRTSHVTVPIHHEMHDEALDATGGFSLTQADLGLTPFSVMMGALQVKDEMKIDLRIHCRPAPQTL